MRPGKLIFNSNPADRDHKVEICNSNGKLAFYINGYHVNDGGYIYDLLILNGYENYEAFSKELIRKMGADNHLKIAMKNE